MEHEPEHRAGGEAAALRVAPWQRLHHGSWASACAGETKGERGGNGEKRSGSWKTRRGLDLALISLIVFPANAGIQGLRSIGWQPKGHRATEDSAVRSALFFQKSPGIVPAESPLR